MTRARRARSWDAGSADAQSVLAGARKALFVMVAVLAVLWAIQIANWADHYDLTLTFGLRAHNVGSLPDIVTAPFVHFGWAHIEGNSGPLFIFGFLAAYRGLGRFAAVTIVVIITSGIAAWFSEPTGTLGAGASGVVFGYFGYIMVRGIFDRHGLDVLIGAVMALCFAYQFSVLLPHAGVGWQAHVGGLVGGVASGWLFRDRRARHASSAGAVAQPAAGQSPSAAQKSPSEQAPAARTLPSAASHRSKQTADLLKELDDFGL